MGAEKPPDPESYAGPGVDTAGVGGALKGLLGWVNATTAFREGCVRLPNGYFASVLASLTTDAQLDRVHDALSGLSPMQALAAA